MRCFALALVVAGCAAAATWVDRTEYDLVLKIRAANSPQKRLELLDQWKGAYPKSEYLEIRRELYIAAYQALGDGPHTLAVAGEILAAEPANTVGAYWFALLLPEAKTPSPEQLALGEKASRQLLADPKPRPGVELTAHRALGWIDWQRKDLAKAEEEFQKCLQLDANRAETSAWLGTVMAAGQQPDERVPALWQLARASSYRGAGALPDGLRQQYGEVLERLYTSYHGDTGGLDQLRSAAAAAVSPPAGFDIESAAAVALRKQDEELTRTDPQLAAWVRLRQKLEGADGDKYFADTLHGNAIPKLKGALIKAEPAGKPNELTIGIIDASQPEVVLKVAKAFPNEADLGTVLEFEGTADSFVKSPFLVTLNADPSQISGWPEPHGRKGERK